MVLVVVFKTLVVSQTRMELTNRIRVAAGVRIDQGANRLGYVLGSGLVPSDVTVTPTSD